MLRAAWLPGDVEEDESLYVGQRHVVGVHLQVQLVVEAAGVADLLQPYLHVHAFVVEPVRRTQSRDQATTFNWGGTSRNEVAPLPAGEFIGLVLPGLVEVQAELGVDAQTKVAVHLHNLTYRDGSAHCCYRPRLHHPQHHTFGGSRKLLSPPSWEMSWASSRMVHRSIRTSSASSTETRMWWGSSPL